MGADFCLNCLPKCRLTPVRLKQAKAAARPSPENGQTKADVRVALAGYAAGKFDGRRDVGTLTLGGAEYYLSSGMSWGDSPTDAYDELADLVQFFDQFEIWSREDVATQRTDNRVGHEDCPVCSANVHGRVTVALNYLNTGKIAKGKAELKALLPLVQP